MLPEHQARGYVVGVVSRFLAGAQLMALQIGSDLLRCFPEEVRYLRALPDDDARDVYACQRRIRGEVDYDVARRARNIVGRSRRGWSRSGD
jgi:hypothetical protein